MSRRIGIRFAISSLLLAGWMTSGDASRAQSPVRPVPGTNINMVSGVDWPGGDPFLQRQNEPTLAVSSRNSLHLLAGANDYRSVDLPGLPDKVTADGWVGVFKSFDGGQTWRSTLLPGFPQDTSPEGTASPLKGFEAAADPVVRAGANGLFYYAGIVFDRGNAGRSRLFVSRFIDDNIEVPDPIRYLDTNVIDLGTPGQFLDKPWLAVDIPRKGAGNVKIGTQSFPAGNVYVTYSIVQGDAPNSPNTHTKIMFTRSVDGGVTWSAPDKLSESTARGQGTVMAIDPASGAIYVAWRLLEKTASRQPDSIMVAKSTDGGKTFSKTIEAVRILPFDQGTTGLSFRTTGYPSMAVDSTGRVYLVWSEFGAAGGSRIMLSTSRDGLAWTKPAVVDPSTQGHQLMPALSFAAGKLMLLFYDLREDYTAGVFNPIPGSGGSYAEQRVPVADLAGNPDAKPPVPPNTLNVFNDYVADAYPPAYVAPSDWRHTLDARVCLASPADSPKFTPSVRITEYRIGSVPGSGIIEQLDYNPPNLPMFSKGTVPFMGDYIDVAAQTIVPSSSGGWEFNTAASENAVFHAVWTDNRNVLPPLDGFWDHYTPVNSFYNKGMSKFDPTQPVPACIPGQAGMRNQDIYTSRITQGMYVGSPENSKVLNSSLKRAFVVFVENSSGDMKTYTLKILPPPATVSFASFIETQPTSSISARIAPYSSITRTVFVSSSDPRAKIQVEVTDPASGQKQILVLNPDPTNPVNSGIATSEIFSPKIANPKIANPKIANPKIANPDIATPDVSNPKIANPKIANTQLAAPKIANPKIANPKIANPIIANPKIANPKIANTDLSNPKIANPKIANGAMTDLNWTVTNDGNTSAAYNIKLLLNASSVPNSFDFQLILNKLYATPAANGCDLSVQKTPILIANITDPVFATSVNQLVDPVKDATNPEPSNATMWLGPGEEALVTLRVFGPSKDAVLNFLSTGVTAATVTQAADTGSTQPRLALAVLGIATPSELPSAVVGTPYTVSLAAIGESGAPSWSLEPGPSLPSGLVVQSQTGVISWTPTSAGEYSFTVKVQSGGQTATATLHLVVLSPQVGSVPRLSFLAQPANAEAGQPISQPSGVQVKAVDGNGVAVQGVEVTITLAANPGGGTLSGAATAATDSAGVASFPYLQIDSAGTGYRLSASASGSIAATSDPFNITKTVLSFLRQPIGARAGEPISPSVQIYAKDISGPPRAGLSISLTLGSGGGGGALSGATAVTDASGVASFSALSISEGGSGYTLTASAESTSVASAPFEVYGVAFERYPSGNAACANCPVSAEFSSRGVEFAPAASPTLLDYAAQYGPAGMASNHGVWPGAAGTLSMRFPAGPRGVRFEQRFRTAAGDPALLLAAYDAGGNPIPNSQISWTEASSYASGGSIAMSKVTTTITSLAGISRVDFNAGSNYTPIIDGLLTFLYGQASESGNDVIAGDPDLVSASVIVRAGYLEASVRLANCALDPLLTGVNLFLDTDRSPASGFPGMSWSDVAADAGAIGSEFIISSPPTCGDAGAGLLQHTGPQYNAGKPNASFRIVGSWPVSYHADGSGFDLAIPLSSLGNIDGRLNFKVRATRQLGNCVHTDLLDALPNVGSAAATVR